MTGDKCQYSSFLENHEAAGGRESDILPAGISKNRATQARLKQVFKPERASGQVSFSTVSAGNPGRKEDCRTVHTGRAPRAITFHVGMAFNSPNKKRRPCVSTGPPFLEITSGYRVRSAASFLIFATKSSSGIVSSSSVSRRRMETVPSSTSFWPSTIM